MSLPGLTRQSFWTVVHKLPVLVFCSSFIYEKSLIEQNAKFPLRVNLKAGVQLAQFLGVCAKAQKRRSGAAAQRTLERRSSILLKAELNI